MTSAGLKPCSIAHLRHTRATAGVESIRTPSMSNRSALQRTCVIGLVASWQRHPLSRGRLLGVHRSAELGILTGVDRGHSSLEQKALQMGTKCQELPATIFEVPPARPLPAKPPHSNGRAGRQPETREAEVQIVSLSSPLSSSLLDP